LEILEKEDSVPYAKEAKKDTLGVFVLERAIILEILSQVDLNLL